MHNETLRKIIDRYEEQMPLFYDEEHDELFKWTALKTFQSEWFAPEEKYPDFISRFKAATKDFSVLIDGKIMHPSTGVEKLFEKNPSEVEHMFTDVLFADDQGNLTMRQKHMEEFLSGMESLREQYFPANWSYKQDRHSATTYLTMYAPSDNFPYKYSEAKAMATYGGYGFDIGSGTDFSLERYYGMCEEIIKALQQHPMVLASHEKYLKDTHYKDSSLHLLVFDLIYCCAKYHVYDDLNLPPVVPAPPSPKPDPIPQPQIELERLMREVLELELACPDVSEISLIGVDVTVLPYGTGTVIEQMLNQVTVQFPDVTKRYILDTKFSQRPHFENDDVILSVFSEYFRVQAEINTLRKRIESIKAKLHKE